ncbi:Phosphatidylinositol 3-kinase catalytic subunit type 3, partial [Phytophthora pseudosyringae]
MAGRLKEYRYYLSSGVSTGISVKISLVELAPALGCSVSGDMPKRAVSDAGLEQLGGTSSEVRNSPVSEIFLTAQVFSDGLPLHPMVI